MPSDRRDPPPRRTRPRGRRPPDLGRGMGRRPHLRRNGPDRGRGPGVGRAQSRPRRAADRSRLARRYGRRRVKHSTAVPTLERVEAILRNPAVYELAALVPEQDFSRGGRRRDYPAYMWLALRRAALRLRQRAPSRSRTRASGRVGLRAQTRPRAVPERPEPVAASAADASPSLHLRPQPLPHRPGHPRRVRRPSPRARRRPSPRTRPHEPRRSRLVDPSRSDPDAPRRRQSHHPAVPTQARRHARRQDHRRDLPRRAEADAHLHFQGDGETAWGIKYVLVAARSTEVHGRIIVDVEWVPKAGGEANTAMDCFTRLAPHLPGMQGVIYDTALRGVHHQTLLRDLGLLP